MVSDLGATWLGDKRCRFRVWAPLAPDVQLHILAPAEMTLPMQAKPGGYHQTIVDDIHPGTRYKYRLTPGKEFPDPVSRCQPNGVHGPSEVIDHGFDWQDGQRFMTDLLGWPCEYYTHGLSCGAQKLAAAGECDTCLLQRLTSNTPTSPDPPSRVQRSQNHNG